MAKVRCVFCGLDKADYEAAMRAQERQPKMWSPFHDQIKGKPAGFTGETGEVCPECTRKIAHGEELVPRGVKGGTSKS